MSSYNPQEWAPTSLGWSLGYKALLFDPQLGQKASSTSFFQLPNSRSCFCWEQGGKTACYFCCLLQPCQDNRLPKERGDPISCQRTTHLIHMCFFCGNQAIRSSTGLEKGLSGNMVSILQMQMQTALFVVHSTAKHKLLLHFTTLLTLMRQPRIQNRISIKLEPVVSYQFMDSWSTQLTPEQTNSAWRTNLWLIVLLH